MSTETQNTPAPTKTEATPTGEAKPFRSAALYVVFEREVREL